MCHIEHVLQKEKKGEISNTKIAWHCQDKDDKTISKQPNGPMSTAGHYLSAYTEHFRELGPWAHNLGLVHT